MSSEKNFRINNGILEKYKGTGRHVVIPEGVTKIGGKAFEYKYSLQSVVIPDSVTEIGRYAFSGCSSLTIRGAAGSYAEEYAREDKIPFETL